MGAACKRSGQRHEYCFTTHRHTRQIARLSLGGSAVVTRREVILGYLCGKKSAAFGVHVRFICYSCLEEPGTEI
jgi:hypothetical protein